LSREVSPQGRCLALTTDLARNPADLGPGPFQVRVTYHDGSVSPLSEVALNSQMGEG